MTRDETRQAILDIIAEIAPDEDLNALDDEKLLSDQFGLDSMDFLDIVLELRKRYQIEVPEDEYKRLQTMSSTVEYLQPRFASA